MKADSGVRRVVTRELFDGAVRDMRAALADAEHGRALVDRMFELPRGPEWEQALAELRVWSMRDHEPRRRRPDEGASFANLSQPTL